MIKAGENERIERFHLTSKRDAVVTPQGYIVLRFEAWVSEAFKDIVVEQLNAAHVGASVLHGDRIVVTRRD